MTRTDICNMALRAVGEQTIMNLTETSKNAEICNLYFEQVYKDLLRDENWNFAIGRVILAETTTDPTFGYSHSFMLPADHMRIAEECEPSYDPPGTDECGDRRGEQAPDEGPARDVRAEGVENQIEHRVGSRQRNAAAMRPALTVIMPM